MLLEIFSDKAMTQRVAKVARHVPGKSMFTFVWKGWFGKKRAEAGKYWCRVMLKDQPETAKTFTLEVEEGPEPDEPLRITGPLLPETDDPDELLELLCAPLTVVDIDATAHQKIYAEPGERGGVLGRVHGQSQGLCVLEIGEKYTKVGAWRHEDGAYIEGYVPTKLLKIVRPYEHYGVVVDKPLQELRVYEYGRLVGRMRISTGLMEKNELAQETRAGAFITTDRMITFESHGFDYDYPIRIDGGNLLHQLGRVSPEQGGFRHRWQRWDRRPRRGVSAWIIGRMQRTRSTPTGYGRIWNGEQRCWCWMIPMHEKRGWQSWASEVDRRKKNRRNAKIPLHSAVRCG